MHSSIDTVASKVIEATALGQGLTGGTEMYSLTWLILIGFFCFWMGFITSSMLSTRGNKRKSDLKHVEIP